MVAAIDLPHGKHSVAVTHNTAGMELIRRGKYRWGSLVICRQFTWSCAEAHSCNLHCNGGVLYTTWMMIAVGYRAINLPGDCSARGDRCWQRTLRSESAAAQIIPSLELTQLSQRAASSSAIAAHYRTPQLLTILLPGIMGYPPGQYHVGRFKLTGSHPLCWNPSAPASELGNMDMQQPLPHLWRWLDSVEHSLGARLAAGASSLSGVSAISSLSILGPVLLSQFGILLTAYGAVSLLRHRRHCPNRLLRSSVIAALLLLAVAAVTFATQQWPDPTEAAFHRATTALRDSSAGLQVSRC